MSQRGSSLLANDRPRVVEAYQAAEDFQARHSGGLGDYQLVYSIIHMRVHVPLINGWYSIRSAALSGVLLELLDSWGQSSSFALALPSMPRFS